MGNSNTATRLERADKTGVLVLQKQMPPLTKVPDAALKMSKLRTLDLAHNQIKKLGPAIGALSGTLTSLVLSHNRMSELDPVIGTLSRLELLDVRHNSLATLPAPIVGCRRLKKLHVDDNALVELPAAIGDLCALVLLTASRNKLAALPDDFGRLAQLVEVDLSDNELALLPASLSGCERLRLLKLRGNRALAPLPAALLTDTALDRVEVDEHLIGGDGLLAGDGADAYNGRRKQLLDKELHAKLHGGDLKFST
ncbi:hypothetical protein KFE25_005673 [Diacronema lutheri]|uniref:Uncharacterized protein n=1 Tax=Diacronema lutheri TaxID=2081491 RepID=A0A8J5X9N5_DIALT|nr:hypothetical protein KFE25_005673 [Diacronema lutheri]